MKRLAAGASTISLQAPAALERGLKVHYGWQQAVENMEGRTPANVKGSQRTSSNSTRHRPRRQRGQ